MSVEAHEKTKGRKDPHHLYSVPGHPGIYARRSVPETMVDPESDVYEKEFRRVGKLSIQDDSNLDERDARENGMLKVQERQGATTSDKTGRVLLTPPIKDSPSRLPKSSQKTSFLSPSQVATPGRDMLVDETEWRSFIQPDPTAEFPAEKGRYHLYASLACPGSHRALIVRALKGLEDCISVTYVHPIWRLTKNGTPEEQRGWVFGDPDGEEFSNTAGRGGPFPAAFECNKPDPIFNAFSVRDIYEKAGDTAGRYTVPFIWDMKKNTIVNNESSDIAYMLNSSFNEFAENPDLDLYTEDDPDPHKLIDVIEWLSPLMIHGVYRCGFAKTQKAYNKAITELTMAFDRADAVLQKQRFLTGDTLTDADIRLFVTLLRFDEVYAFYFRANTRLVMLTPSLLNYCREIYQMPGVAETCNMEQIKTHFYASHAEWNKFSIIPQGLGFLKMLEEPHNREDVPSSFDYYAVDEKKFSEYDDAAD
jgi:putative glutathione S-transferase